MIVGPRGRQRGGRGHADDEMQRFGMLTARWATPRGSVRRSSGNWLVAPSADAVVGVVVGPRVHPTFDVDDRCARRRCVIRFIRVEFHRSASKHGVDNDDVLHAGADALVVADMGDDESPLRTLVLGPDRSGNMLEVIVLDFDDSREMVTHAIPMRAHYLGLLPRPPET